MAPKIPSVDKLNTYWFKMKPAASRAPSFKAMGLLLECLNSRFKLVKIPGRYERSIPVLKLRKSKPRPRKQKIVDPKSTIGVDNLKNNPTKHKEKDFTFEDNHDRGYDHRSEENNKPAGDEPAGDEPVGDEPAGDKPAGDKPAGDEPAGDEPAYERSIPVLKLRKLKPRPRKQKIVDPESTNGVDNLGKNPTKHKEKDFIFEDSYDSGYDHRSEEDNEPAGDEPTGYARQHIKVEKTNKRFSEPQRKIPRREKSKKPEDQPSTAKMSPIKDQRDQESPEVVEENEENLSAKITPHRVKLIRSWSVILQAILLKAPTLRTPCTRDELKIIYLEKSDSLKEKGEECLAFIDVFDHFVTKGKQHNDLFYIKATDDKIYIVDDPRERREMNTRADWVKTFPEIYHERIDESCMNDVVSDGNCGFRAIAKALKMPKGEDDWSLVREQMLKEMDGHKKLYTNVMGVFTKFGGIKTALTLNNGRAGKDKWMDIPDMGLLIATTFNVALLVLSEEPYLFLPLRQAPPAEKTIICIAHVDTNHFVEVSLKSEPPLPPVFIKWGKNKYSKAREWERRLQSNIELYTKKSKSMNHSKNHVDLDD